MIIFLCFFETRIKEMEVYFSLNTDYSLQAIRNAVIPFMRNFVFVWFVEGLIGEQEDTQILIVE